MSKEELIKSIGRLQCAGDFRTIKTPEWVEELIRVAKSSWEYRNSSNAAYDLWGDDIAQNLIPLLIESLEHSHSGSYPRQVMPKIGGRTFRCECGCNVMTEDRPYHYICNSCGEKYTGEPTKEAK